jgi:hypothetical protein
MQLMKAGERTTLGRFYFVAVCVGCQRDMPLAPAPDPTDHPRPNVTGVKSICAGCSTQSSYRASEIKIRRAT